MKDSPDSLVVLDSFIGRVEAEDRFFRAGELVRANDPAVKKWPQKFGPVRYQHELPVEQATAAPGEKRGK